jgi:hypothetical protein
MLKVKTIADLDKLRAQECAVVFVRVDWAIHSHQSASRAELMIADWKSENPTANIDLLQIDLSGQSGEMWDAVEEWLGSQSIPDAEALMYGGYDPIMWVRSGTIVRYVINAKSETETCLGRTDEAILQRAGTRQRQITISCTRSHGPRGF